MTNRGRTFSNHHPPQLRQTQLFKRPFRQQQTKRHQNSFQPIRNNVINVFRNKKIYIRQVRVKFRYSTRNNRTVKSGQTLTYVDDNTFSTEDNLPTASDEDEPPDDDVNNDEHDLTIPIKTSALDYNGERYLSSIINCVIFRL
jgi:hypothetical protein